MPAALAERVELLLTHSVGCTASFTQVAGVEALTRPQDRWRRWWPNTSAGGCIVAGLNAIPGVPLPGAARRVLCLPQRLILREDVGGVADYLLGEAGVAVLPGTSFGRHGEGYLRLVFANSMENIELALARMVEALGKLR